MKTAPTSDFARALRAARLRKGLSQESFDTVSGRTYISELERGERNATLVKIDALASVLGVHPLTLLVMAYVAPSGAAGEIARLLTRVAAELADLGVGDRTL